MGAKKMNGLPIAGRALAFVVILATTQVSAEDASISPVELAKKAWMNTKLSPAERTQLILQEMRMDEKLKLVFGLFGSDAAWKKYTRPAEAYTLSAGFVYGVPRLGIPHLWETDAGIGVASQDGPDYRPATALPAGISTASTWNRQLAYQGGAMIGAEARGYGFNVMLAGGVNLVREPRNGRNFEYAGEDPLLAGVMVGEQIRGIQSNQVISTLKHFAMNDQETGRSLLNVQIADQAARMSDFLALQIAKEVGNPGSVMCGYNRVNGYYSCENNYLLTEVLKQDWGFKGWVMSDWGSVHSTVAAANNGLDQQSGESFDKAKYFGPSLKEAIENGWVTEARLNDMAGRILHAMFEFGVIDQPVSSKPESINFSQNAKVSLSDSQEGMVLLKNQNKLLPLTKTLKKVAIIGGNAHIGVLAGGGSSLVYPKGGNITPDLEPKHWPGPVMHYPSSPMKAIQARIPHAQITYLDGSNPAAAAALAADSDIAIVFANQWTGESFDMADLSLPKQQDATIAAVVKANSKTLVVLQTGGPVTMPWLGQVGAVLEAWYPGTSGGEAIAKILFGETNPSGHLPVTFPASEAQLPRPVLDGFPEKWVRFDVDYNIEGAAVGYKWYDLKNLKPLFPFGYGLSYSEFAFSNLKAELKSGQLTASFTVKNTGAVAGKAVAQIYLAPVNAVWESPKRLGGFQKVDLKPSKSTRASVTIDPRLLAMYNSRKKTWTIAEGEYQVMLASSSADIVDTFIIRLPQQVLDVNGK